MINSKISIIIINWNGKKWLRKCLDSLRRQTNKNIEIILVDNASTDESVSYIKKNYPECILIIQEINVGFAQANSIGIQNAKGQYILLLNNDTWLDSNFLTDIYSFYKNSHCDIVAPMENDYNNTHTNKYITKIDILGHTVVSKKDQINSNYFFYKSGVCLFFNKNLYQVTKGFDNDFFMYVEEVDWFWRLHLLKKKLGIASHLFVHHAGAGSTGGGIKQHIFLWRNQNTLQMLLKNYASFTLVLVLPVYLIQNVCEILFFLILLKPKIAQSYIESWIYSIKNRKKIMEKRTWIQHNRKISDFTVMKKMYFGLGKIKHLFDYIFP